ncbi:uncharacterized protein LAESUDRAFT_760835 [Laetiporus sulphureus 93-53]|uniref:Uncharacterized protein n=1 Tax=Laetiporus sulphureus 93-53 TaxID=1314785 RepID=A0A165DG37_9APHY|nr:uncharacterized protein LAESUDRAFT_760835 [Laetiporus sulphureus 93-53]KZT04817.1 hypothetical protein LAESUDRAFT_760835 [Laetiporus sulphureus 93-53]
MNTHRMLHVNEIILTIFENLSPGRWSHNAGITRANRADRRTLANLARVSKQFQNLASHVLWRNLDSLDALFCVILTYHEENVNGCVINKHQLGRFQQYASLVHTINRSENRKSHRDIIATLWVLNGQNPILPNLRHLSWDLTTYGDHYVLLLAPEGLRSLEVGLFSGPVHTMKNEYIDLSPILNRMGNFSSAQDLQLEGHFPSRTIRPITGWQHLHTVDIVLPLGGIYRGLLDVLASIEELTNLTLRCIDGTPENALLHTFSNLKTLTIVGKLPLLYNLLNSFEAPVLQSIKIFVDISWDANADAAAMGTLQRMFSRLRAMQGLDRTLREFHLRMWHIDLSNTPLMTAIWPLLALGGLEVVEIELSWNEHLLFDDDIKEMASAWPDLVRLRIGYDSPRKERCTSVATFADVLARCPRLVHLELPALIDTDWAAGPMTPHPLRKLFIRSVAFVSNMDRFASFLHRQFPDLDIFWMDQQSVPCHKFIEEGAATRKWDQLIETLFELRSVQNSAATTIST